MNLAIHSNPLSLGRSVRSISLSGKNDSNIIDFVEAKRRLRYRCPEESKSNGCLFIAAFCAIFWGCLFLGLFHKG